ncbi:MAG TPA: LCP family protein [Candidatus Copromorpha excrementigallinarum]|uniref:LCP family protein n=1 Tax=Candidatus Allocopromorpha excrementigallinarum TaxID=2840742 RepID=A0A9D1L621_9FIRM|nr:LCP family protein [Candidatus Copromorpha excrementigallinarum]
MRNDRDNDPRYQSRDTRQIKSTSASGNYGSNEQRAKEQAYQEYLSLRENRGSRGNYIKDDTLYGEYFPGMGAVKKQGSSRAEASRAERQPNSSSGISQGRSGSSIENTPYGASEMRKKSQEQLRQEYMKARQEAKEEQTQGKKPVGRPGRKNRDDRDRLSRAEKKAMKKAAGGGSGGGGKKKKSGRALKVALIATLVLVLGIGGIIAAGLTVVKNTLDNVGRIELDPDLIGINPQVDSDLRNYRNIALLGIDARDMSSDEDVRSDAIIIVSINKKTDEIKMFSVYRDTLLDLGEDVGLDKITHAYYYGGPTKVLYTLNKNLDLNIKEVVVVNWKSVADTVDALGGLDIEIQESEIREMNKYIQDTYNSIGGSNEKIQEAGMQTLNGNQAVTYARIRKDAVEGDYRRNERMKIVVQAAFEKAKEMNVNALQEISNEILPEIKTNMSSADMMSMLLKLDKFSMTTSVGWPYEVGSWSNNGWYGPPVTLRSNVSQLHEEFFGQEDYTPTQDVQDISEDISWTTGLY